MPRRWIIALSLTWGLAFGAFAAAWTAATLLAAGWIYLYGDGPWPEEFTDRTVPLLSALVGLLVLAAVAALWALLPRMSPWLDGRLRASAALRWSVVAIPILLVGGATWALQRQEAAADRARAADAIDAKRQADAHRLVSAEWRLDASIGLLRLDLVADGVAAGAYALRWEAGGAGARGPIGAGSLPHSLPAGTGRLSLELDAAALARSYAEAILSRPETVEIDLPLSLGLSLVPDGANAQFFEPQVRVTVPLSYGYRPDGRVEFLAPGG